MADITRTLRDLMGQRTEQLAKAQEAHDAGKDAEYDGFMAEVKALNAKIEKEKDYVAEQQRFADEEFKAAGPSAEDKDKAAERGRLLQKGDIATFSTEELRRAIKSTTVATTTVAKPTEVGGIHPGFDVISSLIDQVRVIDLSGCGQINEAYVISDMAAQAGAVGTLAGTDRTASDPTMGIAQIKPYEVDTTSFVDRNLKRLSPLDYEASIQSMVMRAMRRKVNALISEGDGQQSPDMYGIKTATNAAGSAIYDTYKVQSTTITADMLMELVFAYGAEEEVGGNARLFLNKADLKAIAQLRGTNEKKNLFDIRPDAGNPNTGMITDGGVFIPYTIRNTTALSTSTRHATNDILTMFYGDPANYELGLFGPMTVRVDESYKAQARLDTVLGDCMVGGNLIVHKGFVVLMLEHGT